MRLNTTLLPVLLLVCASCAGYAQDSALYAKVYSMPEKFFNRISAKSIDIERKLDRQTEKYLARLEQQEKKLQRKMWKKDSAAAKAIFGDVSERYRAFRQSAGSQLSYHSNLDSMQVALRLLTDQPLMIGSERYRSVLANYTQLQSQFNQAAAIKQRLKERQQYLKHQLHQFGLVKQFKRFEKDVYYYRAQVDEYKRLLDDPSKLEAEILQLATKIPAFKEFFSKHSLLAGLFRLPGNDPFTVATPIPGLQTRASVQQAMVQRFGSGPDVSRAMQQNIQSAQAQIHQLKEKISKLGGGSNDMDMPDFKPNAQKVKSFWQRIELGANVQSVKSNAYFPVTSDLGLSAGYKLSDKSVIGLGMSYKLGWGENIRRIRMTHEGVGLRSFFELKVKGSFYATGGFEYNYQQPFASVRQLPGADNWQQSGLVGLSKVVAVRSKLFKKTKVQLLWDFLSYQQLPRTQAIKFRIGYGFN